jgi:hypothetical protein
MSEIAIAVRLQSTITAVNASDKIPAGNLVKNPSFEQGTANWDMNDSNLSTEPAADAPDRHHVVRVAATQPSGTWAIDNTPAPIESVAGRHYTASAWVKGTDSSDGTIACLTVRERSGDTVLGRAVAGTPLSVNSYRPVRVPYVARGSGHRIDVYVFADHSDNGAAGDAFLADALTLSEGDASLIGSDC